MTKEADVKSDRGSSRPAAVTASLPGPSERKEKYE
jgi:hypothetical protein